MSDLHTQKNRKTVNPPNIYTVKKGDTLYAIAFKNGLTVNYLIKRNDLKAPYIIYVGQKLQLTTKKRLYINKKDNKSDLPSQNVKKTSASSCTAQKCNKKKAVKVAPKKTKEYPAPKVDKKPTVSKKKSTKSIKVASWAWPIKGQISKSFSASQSGMQGISIVDKRGSPISASASGTVVYAGSGLRGYGNLIIIKHNYDYLSAYAHNETLLVRENEKIKVGQKIATMGDSGSDHVHLHFEIRYRGKSVDPLRYLPKR